MNRSIEKLIGMGGLRTGAALCAMLFAGFGVLVAPKALGQTVAVAEVTGYVTDASGGALPGAKVTMTEIGQNQVHTTTSDAHRSNVETVHLLHLANEITLSTVAGV